MQHALITGGAGFIGSHLVGRLLDLDYQVTVVDNFDDFYDPAIKRANLYRYAGRHIRTVEADVQDLDGLRASVPGRVDVIVHLAAKAGVRPSIRDPEAYLNVNIRGTHNVLQFAKERSVGQFVFASSSSVYGINSDVPWREDLTDLRPASPYAWSKLSAEAVGHVYAHLYGIRFLALRFFTVYGPRQRPDLAVHKFARLLRERRPLPIYGDGSTSRDYTYIDDTVSGIVAAMSYTGSNYEVINLGSGRPIGLVELVHSLERAAGLRGILEYMPSQEGDVPLTYADVGKAARLLGYRPCVSFEEGLQRFWTWMTLYGRDPLTAMAAGSTVSAC